MANYRYATKDLSISSAEAFVESIQLENGDVYYVVIGKNQQYYDEPTPSMPEDNEQNLHYDLHRNFIGGKKITSSDISHVTDRHNWEYGSVYSMYRDTDEDMYDRPFYVLTDENNVYKCLSNNKGSQSLIKPRGFSLNPFTTSDGYTWKYMYTISLGDASKFLTSLHMPVKNITSTDTPESSRQLAVQNAAVNGAINVIETVKIGSNYKQLANGVVEAGGKTTLRIGAIGNPSSLDNFYNGCSVYVISGTGSGQLRRIIDYSGSTKTLTVNTAFKTVCNTDSRVIISPSVTIVGDGSGAKAYTIVDTNTGSIANVSVIDTGRNYTKAKAFITSNTVHGTGATANVVISPLGGHGSNPIRELYADKVLLNAKFLGNEGQSNNGQGYIPSNTEFRSISILKNPILKVNSNNVTQNTESVANSTNSPTNLRFTTRMSISYIDPNIANPIQPTDVLTNERMRLRAELADLEFITELNPVKRTNESVTKAFQGANAHVVYIRQDEDNKDYKTLYLNNVESYSHYPAFVKDDEIIRKGNDQEGVIARVKNVKGPEANTFSGQVVFTENVQVVERNIEQTEDIKIILDF